MCQGECKLLNTRGRSQDKISRKFISNLLCTASELCFLPTHLDSEAADQFCGTLSVTYEKGKLREYESLLVMRFHPLAHLPVVGQTIHP
jgi:hypothetical protein